MPGYGFGRCDGHHEMVDLRLHSAGAQERVWRAQRLGAFLAPDLVKAAIEGRLPHGMGVVRLADLPAEWSRQHQMLGLPAQ